MAGTADPSLARSPIPTDAQPTRNLTPGELAWIAAIPCALVVYLTIMTLGQPIGGVLFPTRSIRYWGGPASFMPEPTEDARFLLAALGPLLLAMTVVLLSRQRLRHQPFAVVVIRVAEGLTLAFAGWTVAAQHAFDHVSERVLFPEHRIYFTTPTLVVSVLLALLVVGLLHRRTTWARLAAAARETPARRLAALGGVGLFTSIWLLTAVNTDGSIGNARTELLQNIPYWLDETFAVLNGSAPLVDFHAQYSQLWPYVTAGVMVTLGTSLGVFSVTSVLASGAAMLAIFATFRRIVRSSLTALVLFLPFLATSFFREQGTMTNRYGPSNLFSLFPVRYGSAYLLAWLVGRHLDGARPRRAWLLLLVGGLVAINNPEFGGPALAATFAALAWTAPAPLWRSVGRLAGAASVGALGAVALVAALTLAVAGSLPHFELVMEFSRVYALSGFGMLPMPSYGIHLAIYLTLAATIVVATVRAVSRDDDRLLTGMLCWSGVFGIGASAYYAGRSHPEVLIDIFSAWALALVLLLVVAARAVASRPSRWPTAAELAVFLGFGVAICSIAQTPMPWSQVARLRDRTHVPRFHDRAVERFIRRRTRPGQRIGILGPLGHRIAYDIGRKNVAPYAQPGSMPLLEQWDEMLRVLTEHDVHALFISPEVGEEQTGYLGRAGWTLVATSPDIRMLVR